MSNPEHNTRSHILATGRRLTAQQGYTGVGLSELLKEASVPKGSFYHYFASKEAYGCALLEDFIEEYRERLGNSLTHPTLDARSRLLAYFNDWHQKQISATPEDRCLVVRLSAEVADLSEGMSKILQQGVTAVVARLAETLEQGIAQGTIAPFDDPRTMAQTIYHLWLGASLVASLTHSDAPLKSAMQVTEALIRPG
ncbi:MAG: TetR/AcrR family transcriptional regulator [Alphaproteobacteria bacterium]|nr:TetR/AcrR family transcriptional regulator [Alphaproteobacteria bacterium]